METRKDIAPEFILSAIRLRLQQETDKLVEQAKKDLIERTPEIVAGVVVDLMKMVSFQDMKERVIFTIEKSTK